MHFIHGYALLNDGVHSPNISLPFSTIVSSGTTINLGPSSLYGLIVTGSSDQTVNLGNASGYPLAGRAYCIVNDSSGTVSVVNSSGTVQMIVLPKDRKQIFLVNNSNANGVWVVGHNGLPNIYSVTQSNSINTSSTSFQNALLFTPPAGTYLVTFSPNISTSGLNNLSEFRIAVDGVEQDNSMRQVRNTTTLLGGLVSLSASNSAGGHYTEAIVTVNGSQAIIGQYRFVSVSSGSGDVTILRRKLTLQQVNHIS